jgi:hypothetical protein
MFDYLNLMRSDLERTDSERRSDSESWSDLERTDLERRSRSDLESSESSESAAQEIY